MTIRKRLETELSVLSEKDLELVEGLVTFLQSKRNSGTTTLDEVRLKFLYAESAKEDRMMAQEGMADYTTGLTKEDKP